MGGADSGVQILMGIAGDLDTMSFADLLQWSGHCRKSGTLEVSREGTSKKIFFETGRIVSAATDDPREYLGQFLISRGKITEEQLEEAFASQQREGILLGRILVGLGRLSEEELRSSLQTKIMETIFNIFLWDEGRFRFDEGQLGKADVRVQIELEAAYCVFEGIRRVDEWKRCRSVFPTDRMVLAPGENRLPKQQRATAAGRLMELAAAGMTIEEMALELHAHTSSVLPELFRLHEGGYVRPTGLLRPAGPGGTDKATPGFESESEEKEYFYGGALPPESIPVLLTGLNDIKDADISPMDAFLLTRINGLWNMKSLVLVSPIKEIETLRSMKRFLDMGFIAISRS